MNCGKPAIVNGKLKPVGNEVLCIEIGNNQLSNYTAEFDLECGTGSWTLFLSSDVYYAESTDFYGGEAHWYEFRTNQWNDIAKVGRLALAGGKYHLRVVRANNSYQLYSNGKLISEMLYGSVIGSPFSIKFDPEITIDNLIIKAQ